MLVFSGLRERRQWRMNYLQQEQSHFRDASSDEEAESPQWRRTIKSFGPDGSKTFAQHIKVLFVPRSHCGKNKKKKCSHSAWCQFSRVLKMFRLSELYCRLEYWLRLVLSVSFSVITQFRVKIVITESKCSRLTREKNINQIWLRFPWMVSWREANTFVWLAMKIQGLSR